MAAQDNRIIWGDVETNGVDAFDGDVLLEVAVLVTDGELNILDEEGYEAVIFYSPKHVERIKENTVPFVLNMHENTKLWDKLPTGKPLDQVDDELLAYMKQFVPDAKIAPLAGNSITLDRNFMNRNLPNSFAHLSYQSIDVSSIARLAAMWGGSEIQYKKKKLHSAKADITESIEELRYLRRNAMKF